MSLLQFFSSSPIPCSQGSSKGPEAGDDLENDPEGPGEEAAIPNADVGGEDVIGAHNHGAPSNGSDHGECRYGECNDGGVDASSTEPSPGSDSSCVSGENIVCIVAEMRSQLSDHNSTQPNYQPELPEPTGKRKRVGRGPDSTADVITETALIAEAALKRRKSLSIVNDLELTGKELKYKFFADEVN